MTLTDKVERFWSHVDIQGMDDCWEWQGTTQSQGYGSVWMDGKSNLAHRISFFIANGKHSNDMVLHTCDNRKCVNPNHLREGTHLENMRDKRDRGRVYIPRKLTPEAVAKIRKSTEPLKVLAKKYGVKRETIGAAKRGVSWQTTLTG